MGIKGALLSAARRTKFIVRNTRLANMPIPSVLNADQSKQWHTGGYLILPGFFAHDRIDQVLAEVERFWTLSRKQDVPTVADIFIGTKEERRVRLHQAPAEAMALPHKINDLFLESEVVRSIVLDTKLSEILAELLKGVPLCCNTLNFEYGSQQPYHTDSLYMTPPKDLNLAATWVALEDCVPEAGPLAYYPGSHLIPPYRFSNGGITNIDAEMPAYRAYMAKEVAARGLKDETFCARKGDVFIWHSQLYHGGSAIRNPKKTRRSLVTHYFRVQDLGCQANKVNPMGYYMVRGQQPVK